MRPALLIGAGFAALLASVAPARAATSQPPCDNPNLPAATAPCAPAPCPWTPQKPCAR
jgi:hypothetical protein